MQLDQMMGSLSALSLASPANAPLAIAGLVVGGAAITVAAASFAFKKYEQYEDRKHRKEMEYVNDLHRQHLSKIYVPGYGLINPLPKVFDFITENDISTVQSLHYNDEEVIEIGRMLPHGTDVALAPYRELIRSALLKLKEYYFSRDDHHDVTAGVLSYLMNIIETKCLNFAGYDFDIAYLTAICKFIDAYASKDDREDTQHFSRLSPVYEYLSDAKDLLEAHKESLSMQELVAELKDNCAAESYKLIRFLVQMGDPNANGPLQKKLKLRLADTASIYELKDGLLRRKYIRAETLKGVIKLYHDKLEIPDTPIKEWIVQLSKYYLDSLSPVASLKDSNIVHPDEMFAFVPWAQKVFDNYNPKDKQTEEYKQLTEELDTIRDVFKQYPNFINTKLVMDDDVPKFYPVSEYNEIIDRTDIISSFARLIHSVISLQYLCTHLLKSIKQLGELYVQDPSHFRQIFFVLENLCQIINNNVKLVKDEFKEILVNNKNSMRIEADELFPMEVDEVLQAVKNVVKNYSDDIREYRIKCGEDPTDTAKSASYEMLSVANMIANLYAIPEDKNTETAAPCINKTVDKSTSQNQDPKDIFNPIATIKTMHDLTSRIQNKIYLIQKEQPDNTNIKHYNLIYQTLNSLQSKSIDLLAESHKDLDRVDKAKHTSLLTTALCQSTINYLSLPTKDRLAQTKAFTQTIHAQLDEATKNGFIDRHYNLIPRFLYNHFGHYGFFKTDTRRKLSDFNDAVEMVSAVS